MVTGLALGLSAVLTLFAAALRLGGASLVRTPRAEALHDAAEGDRRASRVAALLRRRAFRSPPHFHRLHHLKNLRRRPCQRGQE